MANKPARKLARTMVIICEDDKVAPDYLSKIRKEAREIGYWGEIMIRPLPPDERSTVQNNNPHKSKRTIRKLALVNEEPPYPIEPAYKAVPTRYVREAQLRMEEAKHDEGWAVYDMDGHPHQEQAFELSRQHPLIHIAFASIAIEHWFLIHFEQNATAYKKSKDVPLHKYIPDYESNKKAKTDIYKVIQPHLKTALENAAWIRYHHRESTAPFYTLNPYISIDQLINRLLSTEETYEWYSFGQMMNIRDGLTACILKRADDFLLQVDNHTAFSMLSADVSLFIYTGTKDEVQIPIHRTIIQPGATFEMAFSPEKRKYLHFSIGNKHYKFELS